MPGPWRLAEWQLPIPFKGNFNLRRDARPLATYKSVPSVRRYHNFNLRRDARPLATCNPSVSSITIFLISISDEMPGPWRHIKRVLMAEKVYQFQSQTRCQAPGDCDANNPLVLAHY